MQNNIYDVVIIGGGASGMMAAISAKKHHPDFKIAILDRTFALGRKILVSGAGRCNITNINLAQKVESSYYGADKNFIEPIFSKFGYDDIITFFNKMGVELYTERKTNIGKVFPITDQAQTITSLMIDELERNNIKIFLNTDCTNINKTKDKFFVFTKIQSLPNVFETNIFESKYLILAAGGKTYPVLGANGSGYELAKKFGHNIIPPVPSALPLEGKNPMSQDLQGIKMEIEATSIIDGKEIKTRSDDVMFTKYGLSGPAILNISREISIHFNRENKNNVFIKLNFFPSKTMSEVESFLENRWKDRPEQKVEISLYGILPNKVPAAILREAKLNKDIKNSELREEDKAKLINVLTNHKIKISGTMDWSQAEFTAGGIDSKEINNETLESKLCKNLYLCGEIIDVDGDVGGFNLSWSWSSGYVAGLLQ